MSDTVDQVRKKVLGDAIIETLKTIYDPEIPVNIYELGLVYEVTLDDDMRARIVMTLTTPNCPVAESLPEEVKEKVGNIDGIKEAIVEITFDPPWSTEMMSEEAKLELGLL
ncbi:MAG: SUF system Fe-S cluster assembly protein [Bacteroidales bacterium]